MVSISSEIESKSREMNFQVMEENLWEGGERGGEGGEERRGVLGERREEGDRQRKLSSEDEWLF